MSGGSLGDHSYPAGAKGLRRYSVELRIRTCFLVRKSGQDRHLGYGFVTYALLEDSKRAVEEMDGKDLGGRSVHVSFAKARGTLEERRQRASIAASAGTAPSTSKPRLQPLPQERKSKHSVPKGDKHKFVRTLVLGGLNDASKPAAIKKAKKFGKVILPTNASSSPFPK